MLGRIVIIAGLTVATAYGVLVFETQKFLTPTETFSALIEESPEIKKGDNIFTIGWVGDMVPTNDILFNTTAFENVSAYTKSPTIMIGNLEGTFAQEDRVSKCTYMTNRCHAFRGDKSFAESLKIAGFDFINLVNNHSYDFGDEGLADTEQVLTEFDIPFISQTKPVAEFVKDGKKVGILGVSSTPPKNTITDYIFIEETIKMLKSRNDIVILIFHGGAEGSDKTIVTGNYEYVGTENRGNVEMVAKKSIDAGADIVLGSGPHVLRKVEYYKNRPIIYSAGNFFGGNQKLTTKGILGISAIFTVTKSGEVFSHKITPIVLSEQGVPQYDQSEQSINLIEGLSQ